MEGNTWSLLEDGPQIFLVIGDRRLSFPTSSRIELLEVIAAHNRPGQGPTPYYMTSASNPDERCGRDKCVFRRVMPPNVAFCIYCGHPEAGK